MTTNRLVEEYVKENGEKGYRMVTNDIEVIAKGNGGLAPIIIYLHGERDVTEDIRSLRFGLHSPFSYIDNYDEFQSMLYYKEQKAINDLYDSISMRPKNMTTGKQIIWSVGVLLLMTIPLLVALILR